MFEHEKIFHKIGIVLPTEQIIKSFRFIFQGFCLRFWKSLWMTFGTTLGEHLITVASSNMLSIAIDYKNKANMKVAARNINIKMHQLFSWCPSDHCTVVNLRKLNMNLLLNNVYTALVKVTIKLISIFLSNSFFNSFMKMKSEKRTAFCFSFLFENEKRLRALKIQSKNLLNMKIVVDYLNFVFQFIKNTKWNGKWIRLHIIQIKLLYNLRRFFIFWNTF